MTMVLIRTLSVNTGFPPFGKKNKIFPVIFVKASLNLIKSH